MRLTENLKKMIVTFRSWCVFSVILMISSWNLGLRCNISKLQSCGLAALLARWDFTSSINF